MAAMPQPAWTPPPPPAPWGPGRVIALVVGILVLLPALGLLAGGGVLLWGDRIARDDDGFVFSSSESFSSAGYAITSARIDLSTGADWVPLSATLGDARLEVTGTGASSDVFVGVAPVADAASYLGTVARTVVADLGTGNAATEEIQLSGGTPSGPPGEQAFWTAKASGTGTQRLDWAPTDGDWTLVVMNTDGSAGVAVDARLGATVPALGGLAWGLVGAGLFLLVIGVLVVVLAARRRPAAQTGPYGAGTYGTGPTGPPSWSPPAPVDRRTAADARGETPSPAPPQPPPQP